MKKIHRFLQLHPEPDDSVIIDPRIVHQIASVLKLMPGESLSLFQDGGPERIVKIAAISKDAITVKKIETRPAVRQSRNSAAALAITKRDHFELAVQKLSELGVKRIIPILSDRTIKTGVRLERLQAISDEAVELSGGISRVEILEPMKLETALQTFSDPWIIFEEAGTAEIPDTPSCTFAIGPEGGWSDRELELFKNHSARVCSLAPRTLRAETAAILAAYKLLWE